MDNLKLYTNKLKQMLESRKAGDEQLEERLLDEMDEIWYKLNEMGRDHAQLLTYSLLYGNKARDNSDLGDTCL